MQKAFKVHHTTADGEKYTQVTFENPSDSKSIIVAVKVREGVHVPKILNGFNVAITANQLKELLKENPAFITPIQYSIVGAFKEILGIDTYVVGRKRKIPSGDVKISGEEFIKIYGKNRKKILPEEWELIKAFQSVFESP
jgi:hypothetical protein